ncbi:MarR family transcriptional regulator [Clostridium sp. AM58-1XD]|uniref:MarR family winged helix-turn-helix transcriptional regulator n=1 Tax=Clostridium sp. AM58-1XD TaxID=2292307 RepID=UPI0015F51E88|nr:MarR family transcriptional regulator [Clostridium sp. AM58-1XD]
MMEVAEFRDKLITSFLILQVYADESLGPVCREHGVTVQQFHILMELDEHPMQKAGDLSDTVGVLRGNMAGICKKMEQNHWIVRERSQKDERVVLISLTEEGRRVKREVAKEAESRLESIFANEPEETFNTIFAGLDALGKLMEKLQK